VTPVTWSWLGRVPYDHALTAQRAHRAAIIAGNAEEAIWLLEHDAVITTGRRPVDGLPTSEELQASGTQIVHTERGGLATWHGPGQLVAYALVDAWGRGLGARGMIRAMEDGAMRYLRSLGIGSNRRAGYPGVWVGPDKICAVGMHFSRGISMHGIALNLHPDMAGFSSFVPCGIQDGGITSVANLAGTSPTVAQAAPGLGQALQAVIDEATCKAAPIAHLKQFDGSPVGR